MYGGPKHRITGINYFYQIFFSFPNNNNTPAKKPPTPIRRITINRENDVIFSVIHIRIDSIHDYSFVNEVPEAQPSRAPQKWLMLLVATPLWTLLPLVSSRKLCSSNGPDENFNNSLPESKCNRSTPEDQPHAITASLNAELELLGVLSREALWACCAVRPRKGSTCRFSLSEPQTHRPRRPIGAILCPIIDW